MSDKKTITVVWVEGSEDGQPVSEEMTKYLRSLGLELPNGVQILTVEINNDTAKTEGDK